MNSPSPNGAFQKNRGTSPEEGAILKETIEELRSRIGDTFNGITVERVTIGIFFTGVKLSNGSGGLCFTPIKEIPEAVCCPSSLRALPWSGKFRGRPIADFLDALFDRSPMKRAVGIAVVNALSAQFLECNSSPGFVIERGSDADRKSVV